jgi:hypothetical protein
MSVRQDGHLVPCLTYPRIHQYLRIVRKPGLVGGHVRLPLAVHVGSELGRETL